MSIDNLRGITYKTNRIFLDEANLVRGQGHSNNDGCISIVVNNTTQAVVSISILAGISYHGIGYDFTGVVIGGTTGGGEIFIEYENGGIMKKLVEFFYSLL